MPRFLFRRFRVPVILFLAVVVYGVVGYTLIVGGADPIDALYWTTLSFGGVGFRDTYPFGPGAELFSVTLITGLVLGVAIVVGILTDLVGSGELAELQRERRRRRMVGALNDHFIVCGFGRVGRSVVDELRGRGVAVLVIEIDDRHREELEQQGIAYIFADPSHDAVLQEAGIAQARGLLCAVDNDAVNVFITLTARGLNPDLLIIARASEPESIAKLHRAGADEVVSPYIVSGHAMAERAVAGARTPPELPGA